MAMMAIKGIYAEYEVKRLNHGIGFDTAAIELLLPTYAESLGLKGKICRHWALNPHPALIPAIEAGFVEIGAFLRLRAGHGGLHPRPARTSSSPARTAACAPTARCARPPDTTPATCSSARRCRSTWHGNSSTATLGRIAGFGGAPEHGRGCARPPPRQPGLAEGRAPGAPGRQPDAARPEAGRADGRDLPRAHAAGLRREARCLGAGRERPAWRCRR